MGSRAWPSVILVLIFVAFQPEPVRPSWGYFRTESGGRFPKWFKSHPQKPGDSEGSLATQAPVTAQEPVIVQSKQTLQGPTKQLVWSYPKMSEIPERPKVPFVPKEMVPADSVAVRCGETDVQVEVKQDFFGTGQLIQPEHVSLGDCAVIGEDSSAQVLIFKSELHTCGSRLEISEDELVYTFDLVYTPVDFGLPIFRTPAATVEVSCHYPRVHNVSSNGLMPNWADFAATKTAEEILVFTLRLMTDDWKFERASNIYYLGSMLHIEASVIQFSHVPLRVFVHSCVATAVPDVNSAPRYSFIENHGCLVDAKLAGSRSRFLPRAEDDKLQFELEAFTFAEADNHTIYITCQLVATTVSADSDHKACSFTANRWASAEGNDAACLCCDTACEDLATKSALDVSTGDQWEAEAAIKFTVHDPYWF